MYFETRKKPAQASIMPKLIAVVVAGVAIAGGIGMYRIKQFEQLEALKTESLAALGSGVAAREADVLKQIEASSHASEEELSELATELRWVLWGQEGIAADSGTPDGAALDGVDPKGPLPLVVARAERDLLRRDLAAGREFLKNAIAFREKEPVLYELQGRFALAEAEADPSRGGYASNQWFTAMDKQEKAPPEAMPVSKPRITYGYARSCELFNNADGAVNNYKAASEADPSLLWAGLRFGMTSIPADSSPEDAEAALQKLFDAHAADMTPRQKAMVRMEQARRALNTYETAKAIAHLKEAVAADPSASDAALMLGRVYLDTGKLTLALEQLDAAAKIADRDVRIIDARVSALLANNQASAAKKLVDELPEALQSTNEAHVMKARLQRETNSVTDAQSRLEGVLKRIPDHFGAKLELALLKRSQRAKDAATLFNQLMPVATSAGRGGLSPVLRAWTATLTSGKAQAGALDEAQAAAEGDGNALALLILGEAALEQNDLTRAQKALQAAQQNGDLPRIDLLMARLAGKKPETRADAVSLAQKVQSRCGDGPNCDEAAELLKQLQ